MGTSIGAYSLAAKVGGLLPIYVISEVNWKCSIVQNAFVAVAKEGFLSYSKELWLYVDILKKKIKRDEPVLDDTEVTSLDDAFKCHDFLMLFCSFVSKL